LSEGKLSTLDGDYGVIGVEEEVDDESVQFVQCWFSSGVKYDKELESAGPGLEESSDSSDSITSVCSGESEREGRR
jgi:hypothetical protein